ncbi:MAG TPA: NAD(P)H-binding protein [Chitinophagaceae bacterium]|nr:NAD(P)H-binding protein [Chitinophagaceae bacterium]
MSGRTATLIGATGLIGGELLNLLLKDDYFQTVRILVRRPFNLVHPRLEKKLVDFSDNDSLLVALDDSDAIFCTVGTTQKKVKGDKAAYRKVDYDIPVHAARFCKMVGCNIFVVVSSIGANSKSKNFYLKLKGEVEGAIKQAGIDSVHIIRPSMLLGDRKEFRLGEKIGNPLMRIFSFLLPAKYTPIQARDVAKAMLAASKRSEKGFFVCEYDQIIGLAKS